MNYRLCLCLLAALTLGGPHVIAAQVSGARLGSPRTAWVAAKGQPTQGVIGPRFAGGVEVMFADNGHGRELAYQIELLFGRYIPVQDARTRAKSYFPKDAKRVRSYIARGGQTVEVFTSASLAKAFAGAKSLTAGSKPGTFILIAKRSSETTSRAVIAVGNNP